MKENIISDFATIPFESMYFRDSYVIMVNIEIDGLNFTNEIEIKGETFRNNPLLQYIIAYLDYRGGRRFTSSHVMADNHNYGWQWGSYGIGVKDDVNFPWLEEYLEENGIVLYNSRNEIIPEVVDLGGVIYYDSEGQKNEVVIPSFDKFFKGKSRNEMIKFMNDLYEKYGKIIACSDW